MSHWGICLYCTARVELSPEAVECWREMNDLLRRRGQPMLAPNEVIVCPRCLPRWRTEQQSRGARETAEYVQTWLRLRRGEITMADIPRHLLATQGQRDEMKLAIKGQEWWQREGVKGVHWSRSRLP